MAYITPFLGLSYEYIQTYREAREQEVLMVSTSKLAALGEMAGAIAHEINNPLAIIAGHSSMLKTKAKKGKLGPEDAVRISERIDNTVKRDGDIDQRP